MIEKIKKGLAIFSQRRTQETLGDRQRYLGVSEIGGCTRKIVLSKKKPVNFSLSDLIKFERGHLAEEIIFNALDALGYGKYISRQYELVKGYIKAHLDFVYEDQKCFNILEIKSVSSIPDEMYPTWTSQVQLQMGLAKEKYGGSKKVKASLLAININTGEVKAWEDISFSLDIYQFLLKKAQYIWELLEKEEEEDLPTTVDLLCGYCPFIKDCPAFAGEKVEGLDSLKKYLELKEQKKALDKKIKEIEDDIRPLLEEKGVIHTNEFILRLIRRERRTLDIASLKDVISGVLDLNDFYKTTEYSFIEVKNK